MRKHENTLLREYDGMPVIALMQQPAEMRFDDFPCLRLFLGFDRGSESIANDTLRQKSLAKGTARKYDEAILRRCAFAELRFCEFPQWRS